VTTVTEPKPELSETHIVIKVRNPLEGSFEPGDTRQQWKGEAAARFVL